MGLRQISRTSEEQDRLTKRFIIAQDSKPTPEQLEAQADVRDLIHRSALSLDLLAADSREKSCALTHLEEALMWAGKAIFG